MVKCKLCNGTGEVPCTVVNHCDDPLDGYVTCPECDGKGEYE